MYFNLTVKSLYGHTNYKFRSVYNRTNVLTRKNTNSGAVSCDCHVIDGFGGYADFRAASQFYASLQSFNFHSNSTWLYNVHL